MLANFGEIPCGAHNFGKSADSVINQSLLECAGWRNQVRASSRRVMKETMGLPNNGRRTIDARANRSEMRVSECRLPAIKEMLERACMSVLVMVLVVYTSTQSN